MPPPKKKNKTNKNNTTAAAREFGIFACHVQLQWLRSVPRFLPRNHHRTPWPAELREDVPQGGVRYSGDVNPLKGLVSLGADILI